MRIAYIAAGAGGMYCGSCIHDNTLAAALIRKGHEVALIPTYTPIRTDEPSVSVKKIFYGGINVYLEEKLALFRRTPWVVDKLLNNPRLLNWASRFSASTNAKDLGSLTVSVLQGEHGHQRKELAKLIHWLKNDYKPEIVQLTNSMFVGMASEIKKELGVPVLCALQGEDIFLNDLIEPYKTQALELMRSRANDIDGFVVMSKYYADFMAEYIRAPREKIHVVKLGLSLKGHGEASARTGNHNPFVIGYLARICPEKGLHILIEAVARLAEIVGHQAIKLKVAGYLGERDRRYFNEINNKVKSTGLQEVFEYAGEIDRQAKIEFINSLDVFSVPTTYREPKGLSILEALANGVPVVQPRHGAFPEMIEATGGGILVEPNSSQALADGLHELMKDFEQRNSLGRNGKQAIHKSFSDEVMADATIQVYKKYV